MPQPAVEVNLDAAVDLSHLHDASRMVARLPADERLRHVRADRWIGYPRAVDALARLETSLTWPARQRMPNLLLIGPTNNGKSMIVEKFRRTHPRVSHPGREDIPVLAVQMPRNRRCTASTSRCWRRWARRFARGGGWPSWSRRPWRCYARSGFACWLSTNCTTSSRAAERGGGSSSI